MASLTLRVYGEQVWTINNTLEFINGFLTASIAWIKDQTEDHYFSIKIDNLFIPVSSYYRHYFADADTVVVGGQRIVDNVTSFKELLKSRVSTEYYGIILFYTADRNDFIIAQTKSIEFIQGLLSAIDTFNLFYMLEYQIYKDGVFYDIPGRNLIQPE